MASDTQNEDTLAAANSTFEGFWTMLKWGGVAVFLVAAGVIFIITR